MSSPTFIYPGAFNQNPSGGNRYITSGELQSGAGTGDAVKAGANFWTGSPQVFGPQTAVQISGVASFGSSGGTRITAAGDVQTSGVLLTHAGAYAGQVSAATRYVTSGELSAGGGTGDATRTQANTFTAANVFVGPVTVSGLLLLGSQGGTRTTAAGDVQVSGTLLTYSPAFAGSAAGANRYVTSGELSAGGGSGDATRTSENYFTANNVFASTTTFSGAVFHQAPVYQGPGTTGAGRYVTSGELSAAGGSGTVTSLVAGSNVTLQPSNITTSGSVALSPNVSISSLGVAGDTLVSGGLLLFSPAHQGSVSTATRYVTSGELVLGVTSVNGETGSISIAAGSSGSDFAVDAAGVGLLIIQLPTASPTARGAVSTAAQTFGGAKTFTGTVAVPDLTASGVSLLYGPAYQGAATGAARYVTSGELRPDTDTGVLNTASVFWTGAQHVFSAGTSVTLSGSALFLSPAYQGSVAAAQRYVTSGELRVDAGGTVTTINVGSNLIQQPSPITVTGTIALSPDLAISTMTATGNTLVSGTSLHFSPIYQGTQTGSARYVTSGELRPDTDTGITSLVAGSNVVFQPSPITVTGSIGIAPNLNVSTVTVTGPVLLQSGLLTNAPAYHGSISAANRYVTSGELKGGTVTSIVPGSNLVMQANPLTTSGSIGLANSLNIPGDVQVSGTLRIYGGQINNFNLAAPGTQINAFGDSLATGAGSTQATASGFVGIIGRTLGWNVNNRAAAATQLADTFQIDRIYATTVTSGTNSLILTGFNEVGYFGDNANNLRTYQGALYAGMAWLGMPAAKKTLARSSAVTLGGAWASSYLYPGATMSGIIGQTPGSTASTTVYGRTVYVGATTLSGNAGGGRFSVAVDGITLGNYACSGAQPTFLTGRAYAPFLVRVSNLAEGPHTVDVTVVSSGVLLDWFGEPAGSQSVAGPNVFVGNTILHPDSALDPATSSYNEVIRTVCRELSSDGLNVALVDAASYYDLATDLAADGVHPNNQGHVHIAEAFLTRINVEAQPNTKQNADGAVGFVELGTLPATTGAVRLGAQSPIVWRQPLDAGNGAQILTDTTGNLLVSGTTVHADAVYQGAVAAATRYVTSGELPPTGDYFTKSTANYVAGSPIVFGPDTRMGVSGGLAVSTLQSTLTVSGGDTVFVIASGGLQYFDFSAVATRAPAMRLSRFNSVAVAGQLNHAAAIDYTLNNPTNLSAALGFQSALHVGMFVSSGNYQNYTTNLRAISVDARHNGLGTVTTLDAVPVSVTNTSSGTVGNLRAFTAALRNPTGTISTLCAGLDIGRPVGSAAGESSTWAAVYGINIADQYPVTVGNTSITTPPAAIRIQSQTASSGMSIQQQGSGHNRFQAPTTFGADAIPVAGAAIEIRTTSGVVVLPRLNQTQRDALTPQEGMLSYVVVGASGIQAYIGGAWRKLATE